MQLHNDAVVSESTRFSREVYQSPARFELVEWDPSTQNYRGEDARAQMTLRKERESMLQNRYEGVSNVIGCCPGKVLAVEGHYQLDVNQKYLLTRVIHTGEVVEELMHQAEHGQRTSRYTNTFEAVALTTVYRPDRSKKRPVIAGVQTAIVVGPHDEEIFVDEHGRVKVQFHWDRLGKQNERSSCWVRTMQSWAGPGFGTVFLPRIGMEVVVTFLNGDPDRPLITGCVYHGTNRPPVELPEHRTQSVIRTKSSPHDDGYNELRFEDAKNQERIFTHAQKDYDEVVENNHTTSVHANQTNSVDVNQTETVGRDQVLSVHRHRTKTVDGNEQTTVHQNRTEQVDLDERIMIGGNRTEAVAHNEHITVHENRVMQVFGNQSESVSGSVSVGVGTEAPRSFPSGYRVTTIATGERLTVNGSMQTNVARRYSVTVGESISVACQGAGELKMSAQEVSVDSGPPMRLTRAQAEVGFRQDGSIEVQSATAVRLAGPGGVIVIDAEGITITSDKKISVGVAGSVAVFEPTKLTQSAPMMSISGVAITEIAGTLVKIN